MSGRARDVRPVDAIRLALLVACGWVAVTLARQIFTVDAGIGAPSALFGGVMAFGLVLAVVFVERVWARSLARRDVVARPGDAHPGERLAFDGSLPAIHDERSEAPRTPRPPHAPAGDRDIRGSRPPV